MEFKIPKTDIQVQKLCGHFVIFNSYGIDIGKDRDKNNAFLCKYYLP